jgi:membrane-associated phospholipid phosphatase
MVHDLHALRPGRAAMPPVLRRPFAVVALVGVLLVAVPGVLYAGDDGPGRLDRWVQSGVDGAPQADAVVLRVDAIGHPVDATVVVAALAVLCVVLGRRRLAMVAVAGTAVAVAASTVLKPVVDRSIHGESLAYPSGHTALAVMLGVVLALLLADVWRQRRSQEPGWVAGMLLVAALACAAGAVMAWSQITLSTHYPTDTIGGFGTALAVVPAVAWLIDRVADVDMPAWGDRIAGAGRTMASRRRRGPRPPAP